jgi:hypothetical protein
MRLTNWTILILILGVSTILRFYRFQGIPFMHDEFSAFFRTEFNSFNDLIEYGVRPDGHPAGIQVFLYYWIKFFGKAEWIVKLPFAVMGVLSVLLVYLVSRKWYNETVSLICASFIAGLQYTVMYSQIARPYVSGLFFSLVMVYFWSNLMRTPSRKFMLNGIFYALAAALCAYNHHFSLLFAAIVGISGLFIISRRFLLRYILLGLIIFVLYIPHLGIFRDHLETGGVGGWLSKPDTSFFADYLYYIFNYSTFSVLLALVIILAGFYHLQKKSVILKNYLLFGAWFLLPLLIGYWYSVNFNPVLQYSVLLFSFFPLLFVLFGHIPSQKPHINLLLVIIILTVNILTLITERRHYSIFYESPYENIVTDYKKAKQQNNSIIPIIDSHKKITRYYLEKHKADSAFTWFDSFANEAEFIKFLKEYSTKTDHLYFGAFSSNKPNSVSVILRYFPVMVEQNNYYGGSTWVFSKTGLPGPASVTYLNFDTTIPEGWHSVNDEQVLHSKGFDDSHSYLMDSLLEWSPTFSVPLSQIISHHNNVIDISIETKTKPEISEIILVATLESEEGVLHFGGAEFNSFKDPHYTSDDWYSVHHSLKLSDINLDYSNVLLKVFVWNKGRNRFLIDNFKINVREGNPVIYGLYEKIP